MQDRPTAAELLDAAREFLESEIMPELSGRKQFHVRVTVNVLRTLQREWEHEEDAVRREHAALAGLLGRAGGEPASFTQARADVRDMNADLGTKIRAGEMDERFDHVLEALREIVTDKVRIANPNWLGS